MSKQATASQRIVEEVTSWPGVAAALGDRGARRIEDEADVRDVIELLRLNYDRTVGAQGLPESPAPTGATSG